MTKARTLVDILLRLWHYLLALMPWNRVPREVSTSRRRSCEGCQAVDPSGQRLYRIALGRPVCGRPSDPRAPGFLLERQDDRDGCGCWLDLKWRARGEKCPVGRWQS